jgi:hypothetical protein
MRASDSSVIGSMLCSSFLNGSEEARHQSDGTSLHELRNGPNMPIFGMLVPRRMAPKCHPPEPGNPRWKFRAGGLGPRLSKRADDNACLHKPFALGPPPAKVLGLPPSL